jgi:dihydroxy-acid dehydratase
MEGVGARGGMASEFVTITVTDGISSGHEGMRSSLVSREIIADSVEHAVRESEFEALVGVAGCDKTLPALMMAMCRLDVPSIFLYGGSTLPGTFEGRPVSILDSAEGVGRVSTGEWDAEKLRALERAAVPTAGACPMHATASTMACVSEAIGLALPGSSGPPAAFDARDRFARHSGEQVVELIRAGIRPSDIVTREALENAAAVVAATGGSSNAALHLPAIASEVGVSFDLFDIEAVFARTPQLANLNPIGVYMSADFYRVGAVPVVIKMLLDAGLMHGDCLTVTGRTIAENHHGVSFPADQDVVRPITDPVHQRGPLRILSGNLAPDGAIVKLAGMTSLQHRGPARVFESEEECAAAVLARDYEDTQVLVIRNEGPRGGPGMREMTRTSAVLVGQRSTVPIVTDGRFSGATRGFNVGHVSPESQIGGPIGLLRDGDVIMIDLEAGSLEVDLSVDELSTRRAAWRPEEHNYGSGVLWKYGKLVGPTRVGAVTGRAAEPAI